VTFLNGHAVEQTTEGEEHEGTDRGDELEAAKAAVKKALEEDAKSEGKKAAKEAKVAREKDPLIPRDPYGKFLSTKDPVEEEKAEAVKKLKDEAEEERTALQKALAERREVARFKKEAAAALEKERAEARRIFQENQRERQEIEREKARIAAYKRDPVRLAREAGYANPEDYILELAQEGTPEGQARRAQRELMERLERAEQWQRQELEQRRQAAEEAQRQQQAQVRRQVEENFLRAASQHEILVEMYKGSEIELISQADVVAEQYRNKTGEEATFEEIAEYIAERNRRAYNKLMSKERAKEAQAPSTQVGAPVNAGGPTQGSAGKKRPMSASGSERRKLGTSFADLDGEERIAMAKTAVKAAIAASGDS